MLIIDKPLEGQTAIVTGSGRNLGKGIAMAFARSGANVVLNGHRDAAILEQVASIWRRRQHPIALQHSGAPDLGLIPP